MEASFHKKHQVIWLLIAASSPLYLTCVLHISYPLTTFLKPLPIFLLIYSVFHSHCDMGYKALLMLALGFGLCGDISLTLPINSALDASIVFFLFGHWCYIFLFFQTVESWSIKRTFFFLPVLMGVSYFFINLHSHLGHYEAALGVYFFVLTIMIFSTFQIKRLSFLILLGGLLFLISDVIIVYNEFIFKKQELVLITMSTYYLAQYSLVSGALKLFNNQAVKVPASSFIVR